MGFVVITIMDGVERRSNATLFPHKSVLIGVLFLKNVLNLSKIHVKMTYTLYILMALELVVIEE